MRLTLHWGNTFPDVLAVTAWWATRSAKAAPSWWWRKWKWTRFARWGSSGCRNRSDPRIPLQKNSSLSAGLGLAGAGTTGTSSVGAGGCAASEGAEEGPVGGGTTVVASAGAPAAGSP